jgi:hypothetical protein
MSCCGSKRAVPLVRTNSHAITFEYRGRTSLTAVGAVTRRLYWFSGPASRVAVDPRDAESLEGVPNLVRVGSQPPTTAH